MLRVTKINAFRLIITPTIQTENSFLPLSFKVDVTHQAYITGLVD